jgi:hypothetical protein
MKYECEVNETGLRVMCEMLADDAIKNDEIPAHCREIAIEKLMGRAAVVELEIN